MGTIQLAASALSCKTLPIGPFGQNDMYEAQCIQSSLLPTAPLSGESFEIAFRYIPFSEVGGDFADFFRMPDGLVGIYLGDVVGKGLPAAMYGALVMGAFRGIKKTGFGPAAILGLLNERLMQRPLRGCFCSTLYAIFDPCSRVLTVSNAGLPMPLLVSENTCRPLGEGGLPSGMFPDATYYQHTLPLAPGDCVLFATDGLHEMRNREGAEFCDVEMATAWTRCRRKSADESLDYVFASLRTFSDGGGQDDDVTAVALKIPLRR